MTTRTRSSVLAVAAAAAALAAVPAEGLAAKRCGSFATLGGKASYSAKQVSCKAAKRVLVNAGDTLCFDNQVPGWEKRWKALPGGGRALSLHKGAKVIKTNACSPR